MTFNSDSDSCSMDSHSSDFNDGAEVILMDADFKIEAPGGGEGDSQSRSSTPESHKDCGGPEYCAYGQGCHAYSCGCYNYREMERYKYLKLSPPDLVEQCVLSFFINPVNEVLTTAQTLHSSSRDITDMQTGSVPDIKLPLSKCRKLGEQSESFKGGLAQSLVEIRQEVVVLGEALIKVKKGLRRHGATILAICEVLATVTDQEGGCEC
ncbi:uncharacterized protein F5891DRAFT_978936 [Suillus fuscotomentosus]|uniref:Uncharacterized protein n=1 Tax=Suillus fuscotomentosus TaxID=1912939 RepID=A0AAD4HNZ3_9AGAM|nr:uncharacterized protein F5891DRAFT_978936 [Suillus fuscotomentosus]KAG1902234.1 hypothetical protein F5891DRAFT_978936 [Suillus fuscotomentosus]